MHALLLRRKVIASAVCVLRSCHRIVQVERQHWMQLRPDYQCNYWESEGLQVPADVSAVFAYIVTNIFSCAASLSLRGALPVWYAFCSGVTSGAGAASKDHEILSPTWTKVSEESLVDGGTVVDVVRVFAYKT